MGTCLAVIKVVGITSLGLFTGGVCTNVLNGSDIVEYVINSSSKSNIKQINSIIIKKIKTNAIYLSVVGSISTIAFQLAYFGAPARYQHPYLIYSSLIFPISSILYGLLSKDSILKYFNLDSLIKSNKREPIRSELDNSVYKDLGENSEDDEIEEEVEFHLSKKIAIEALDKLKDVNKIVSVISFIGLLITSVGVHGDF